MNKKFMSSNMRKKMALFVVMAMLFSMLPMEAILVQAAEGEGSSEVAVASGSAVEVEEKEPIVYSLDEVNMDEQGIIYTFFETEAYVGKSSTEDNTSLYAGANDGCVIIPDQVERNGVIYDVTKISDCAFNGCTQIKEIVISDTVEEIGTFSLNSATLETIYLGKGVKEVTGRALGGSNLSKIEISEKNPYFTVVDGILYNKIMTEVIRYPIAEQRNKVILPDTVRKVGSYAFYRAQIEEVYFPTSVTHIGSNAFAASKIAKADLSNVEKIEESAFYLCTNMRWVKLRPYVVIEKRGFAACYNLEVLFIPKGTLSDYKSFESTATKGKLKCLIVEETIAIDDSAYSMENNELDYAIIEEGVMQIPFPYYFQKNAQLDKLYIPATVTDISSSIEWKKDLVIHSVTGSSAQIFATEEGLEFCDISQHEHSLAETTFFEDDEIIVKGSYCEQCGYGTECSFEIKEKSEEYISEEIVYELDSNNRDKQGLYYSLGTASGSTKLLAATVKNDSSSESDVTDGHIIIPDRIRKDGVEYLVENVAAGAFNSCSEMTSLSVSSRVQSFNVDSIRSCENLEKLEVEKGNTCFFVEEDTLFTVNGRELLWRLPKNEQLKYVVPKWVCSIKPYAFAKSQVEYIDCSDITELGAYAFYNCNKLKNVRMSEKLESIRGHTFENCTSLKTIYIPSGGEIANSFEQCVSVDTVILGEGVSLSTYYASPFSDCIRLKKLFLPENIMALPNSVLSGCSLLKKIYIPNSLTKEKGISLGNSNVTCYGVSGSAASTTTNYVDITNHAHEYEETVFYEDEYTKILGEYCEECSHGRNFVQCDVDEEVVLPTATPSPTPTNTPTVTPDESTEPTPENSSSPEVTVTPTVTPTATELPEVTPTVTPTITPTVTPTTSPKVTSKPTMKLSAEVTPTPEEILPAVTNFQVKTKDNKTITLSWNAASGAKGYQIYRSRVKKGSYKLLATVSDATLNYTDKKINANKKYHYRVCAINGEMSEIRTMSVNGMTAPKVKITKGKTGNIRYLTIHLKKYKGKYVQIYMKKKGKKFKKINLLYNKIKKYKGKFKLQYLGKNQKLYFKVRTYKLKGKKKIYSKYSKVKKIKT